VVTQLNTEQIKRALSRLGYYDGPIDDDYLDKNYRADLKRFQYDYRRKAGNPDGWYGKKTESALLPLVKLLRKAPAAMQQMRRWQLTYYYVGAASRGSIPMTTPRGKLLAKVSPRSFVEAALEGTTRLPDGSILNVARPAYSKCDSDVFAPVHAIAKRNGWVPKKPGYAGIVLSKDKKKAVKSRNFHLKKVTANGWPAERLGIALDPFRTLASDTGRLRRHDPKYKRKGGVVPSGTKVFILEFVGVPLPDGTIHDGWFTCNDTGGGIFGAHFDVFTGTRKMQRKGPKIPHRAHIWFKGIEKKLKMNYHYGL
jgi:3D (Asp-Asp-Asp) domain-containing protein